MNRLGGKLGRTRGQGQKGKDDTDETAKKRFHNRATDGASLALQKILHRRKNQGVVFSVGLERPRGLARPV